MANPEIPLLRPGQVPTAEQWNRLVALLDATGPASSAPFGEIGVANTRGVQVLDGRLRKHWAKVTGRGAGNLYAHNSVAPAGDGTFIDLPQTSEFPFGTATEGGVPAREVNGLTNFDATLPAYFELWEDETGRGYLFDATGKRSENTHNTPCEPHGWLVDRPILVSANKAFRVQILAGESGGRCACIDAQGTDPLDPWTAIYDSVADNWPLDHNVTTCCGCGTLTLDVPVFDGSADPTWPPMTGSLAINSRCDMPGTAYGYKLNFQCATRDSVVFAAAGPKNCDGPYDATVGCDNAFYVVVTCETCPPPSGPTCDVCSETCTPNVLRIVASGFTTANFTPYNGTWNLVTSTGGSCQYAAGCGGITVTALWDRSGGNIRLTVTFSGAAGGTVVYRFTIASGGFISCFGDRTVAWVSGGTSGVTVPASLVAKSIFCTPVCGGKCSSIDYAHALVTVSSTSGDCGAASFAWTSSDASNAFFAATFGGTGGFLARVTCDATNGLVFFVDPLGLPWTFSVATVSGPSFNPFVWVVDLTVHRNSPPAPSPCDSVYRLVITAPAL